MSKPVCRPGDLALIIGDLNSGKVVTVIEEWTGQALEGITYRPPASDQGLLTWVVELARPARVEAKNTTTTRAVTRVPVVDRDLWPLRPGDLGLENENETVSRQVLKPETLALFFRAGS